MSSLPHGKDTSNVEVTHISAHGLWLLAGGKELFLPFEAFPWFRDCTIAQIVNVEEQAPGHFFWPDIDVDLSEEIIEHPEKYPLAASGE